ncbi:MAG TPA: bacteriohemerythrin [Bryobacteraceae bacterium]|nr:bacteriohemerythrin [Bryobacteraceae bacterium]
MFDWKPEYSVGHAEIDSQHKRLFVLAGDLHTAMISGKGKNILSKTLAELISYTKLHFATEERLMKAHNYPDYAQHKANHDSLTAKVVEFQRDFETGHVAVTVGLLQFLQDWLRHHIRETDRKIALFLKSKAA